MPWNRRPVTKKEKDSEEALLTKDTFNDNLNIILYLLRGENLNYKMVPMDEFQPSYLGLPNLRFS